MTLEELCTLRVAVWGIGHEGLAMDRLLAEHGVVPSLIDDRPDQAQGRLDAGNERRVIRPDQVTWGDLDVVVRAPGVSRYRAELATAAAAGVAVTTAMAVWLEDFATARVVAITGTKGKSTTAALTASILRHQGLEVALIGNIGVPVTDMYGRDPVEAYVVEVSSYQAADVTTTPPVCILTSLAPDHLDWHRGEEAYYRDKLRLIDAGPIGAIAVNAASSEAVSRTRAHPARTLFGPSGRVRVNRSGTVLVDDQPMVDANHLSVPGLHNAWNLCGAVAGALLLTGEVPSTAALESAVEGFEGLPSRCQTVGERGGITFVDDALASNPFAAMASVSAFPDRPLTVILGGADRGVDSSRLVEALAARIPVPRVIVLEPDPQRLAEALESRATEVGTTMAVDLVPDIEEAVASAVGSTPAGGVVLFAPSAPTLDGEGGYSERSRRFVQAVGVSGTGG